VQSHGTTVADHRESATRPAQWLAPVVHHATNALAAEVLRTTSCRGGSRRAAAGHECDAGLHARAGDGIDETVEVDHAADL